METQLLLSVFLLFSATSMITGFSCGFESESNNKRKQICQMYQHDDQFDWVRRPSHLNGPSNAHTGRGYISLETDRGYILKQGDKSSISVPRVWKEGTYCLSFWYYMNNANGSQSTLKLYKNKPNSGTPLWSEEESQGDEWNEAKIEVELNVRDRVLFTGTIGSGQDGDVALDDIKFNKC